MTHFLIDLYFSINLWIAGYFWGITEDDSEDLRSFLIIFVTISLFGSLFAAILLLACLIDLVRDKITDALKKSDSWWIPVRTLYFVYCTKEWDHDERFISDEYRSKRMKALFGGWRKKLLYEALSTVRFRVTKNIQNKHVLNAKHIQCQGENKPSNQ